MWLKKKSNDKVVARFQKVVDLVSDLDKREFNRLMDGATLVWQAHQKISQVKSTAEKEVDDIEKMEKYIEVEDGRD